MRRPLMVFCLIAIACILLGCRRGVISTLYDKVNESLPYLSANPVVLQGQVYQKNEDSIYIHSIILYSENQNHQIISKDLKLICYPENREETGRVPIGSVVLLEGEFACHEKATNPGQFDAFAYYAGQGVCGSLESCKILKCSESYDVLREGLYQLKISLTERVREILPDREASVMNTILWGERSEMDRELKSLYQISGILHIASISGLHISLLAMGLYGLLKRLGCPPIFAGTVCVIVIILYGILTGLGTSTIRAIGMFGIRMLGELLGRTYDMLTALGLLGFLMVLERPDYLWDAGFLLSFGAVAGIGILYPVLRGPKRVSHKFKKKWQRYADKFSYGIWKSFASGLAVTLTLMPVQLWFYYEMPVYSVFLNLLVIPTMGVLVGAGMLMLIPGLGIAAGVPYLLLKGYEWLCESFLLLPGHRIITGRPAFWQIVCYYLILGLVVFTDTGWWRKYAVGRHKGFKMSILQYKIDQGPKTEKETGIAKRKCGAGKSEGEHERVQRTEKEGFLKESAGSIAKWIVLLMGICMLLCGDEKTRNSITFLDVGQGDCICVEDESGACYIFDCGSSNRYAPGKNILLSYLKFRGISEVSGLFLSHGDRDHCNGAMELLQNADDWGIVVKQLILPELDHRTMKEQFGDILIMASDRGIPISSVGAGECMKGENITVLCLNPEAGCLYENDNESSMCIYLSLETGEGALPALRTGDAGEPGKGMVSVLLTGDVEGAGEEQLLSCLPKYGISEIDLLKVAHHGSKAGTSEKLLERICPKFSIISCGRNNIYGHPHQDTLERLKQAGSTVLITAQAGAVTVEFKEGEMQISSYWDDKGRIYCD